MCFKRSLRYTIPFCATYAVTHITQLGRAPSSSEAQLLLSRLNIWEAELGHLRPVPCKPLNYVDEVWLVFINNALKKEFCGQLAFHFPMFLCSLRQCCPSRLQDGNVISPQQRIGRGERDRCTTKRTDVVWKLHR